MEQPATITIQTSFKNCSMPLDSHLQKVSIVPEEVKPFCNYSPGPQHVVRVLLTCQIFGVPWAARRARPFWLQLLLTQLVGPLELLLHGGKRLLIHIVQRIHARVGRGDYRHHVISVLVVCACVPDLQAKALLFDGLQDHGGRPAPLGKRLLGQAGTVDWSNKASPSFAGCLVWKQNQTCRSELQ